MKNFAQDEKIHPKHKRFLIIGDKSHGKDEVCGIIHQKFGINYISSSRYCFEEFLFDQMKEEQGYRTVDEAYNDRNNHRAYLFNSIRAYNEGDLSRTTREITTYRQIYNGMRNREEFSSCVDNQIFDLIIFVDASERKPSEGANSQQLCKDDADVILDNNGPLADLPTQVDKLFSKYMQPHPVSGDHSIKVTQKGEVLSIPNSSDYTRGWNKVSGLTIDAQNIVDIETRQEIAEKIAENYTINKKGHDHHYYAKLKKAVSGFNR